MLQNLWCTLIYLKFCLGHYQNHLLYSISTQRQRSILIHAARSQMYICSTPSRVSKFLWHLLQWERSGFIVITTTLWFPELTLIQDIQLAGRSEASDSIALTLVLLHFYHQGRLIKLNKTENTVHEVLEWLCRQICNVWALWQLRKNSCLFSPLPKGSLTSL